MAEDRPAPMFQESTLAFPYKRSTGQTIGRFLAGLKEQKTIWGQRVAGLGVVVPPLGYSEADGSAAGEWVEVGTAGTVTAIAVVHEPIAGFHPSERPFAYVLVKLDGADTALAHVVTDGLDTASTKTVADVSAAASAIDVPVYVIVVTTPANHPTKGIAPLQNDGEPIATRLANLAAWTGGDMLIASTPAETSLIARRLVVELRHQYQLAFESSTRAGWHQVAVRTRNPGLQVRARTGYFAQPSSNGN